MTSEATREERGDTTETVADDEQRDGETVHVEAFGVTFDLEVSRLDCSATTVGEQVREYERGERRTFDCVVDYPDDFTGRVMRAMSEIPFGETRTYGDLAATLDTASVAVGGACGRNSLPLVVPCHRVVAADGRLGGYSAPGGLTTKRRLLVHEGVLEP